LSNQGHGPSWRAGRACAAAESVAGRSCSGRVHSRSARVRRVAGSVILVPTGDPCAAAVRALGTPSWQCGERANHSACDTLGVSRRVNVRSPTAASATEPPVTVRGERAPAMSTSHIVKLSHSRRYHILAVTGSPTLLDDGWPQVAVWRVDGGEDGRHDPPEAGNAAQFDMEQAQVRSRLSFVRGNTVRCTTVLGARSAGWFASGASGERYGFSPLLSIMHAGRPSLRREDSRG
jgi:hypothetical protein